MSAAYDYIVDMAAAVDKRETRLNAVTAEITAMEAGMKRLAENLEAAQTYAHILGRSVLNDRELIETECQRNNWPLPAQPVARVEQPIEHLARAAAESTQGLPLPLAATSPDVTLAAEDCTPQCGRTLVPGPLGYAHVDGTPLTEECRADLVGALPAHREEVPHGDA